MNVNFQQPFYQDDYSRTQQQVVYPQQQPQQQGLYPQLHGGIRGTGKLLV